MKIGFIMRHLLKKWTQKETKKSCFCWILFHICILAGQTVAFLCFCKKKGISLKMPKWKKKLKCLCKDSGCSCQDGQTEDQAGVADATRPEESEGIMTAEGKIGAIEQTVQKKRSTADK